MQLGLLRMGGVGFLMGGEVKRVEEREVGRGDNVSGFVCGCGGLRGGGF